jgi:hypothetical protein
LHLRLARGGKAGAVVEQKPIAVRAEGERELQDLRVVQRLLHPCADFVLVALGLHDPEGQVGLEVKAVVCELRLAALDDVARDLDAPLREVDLAPDLRLDVPPSLCERGADELLADVRFAQGRLVDGGLGA